MPIVSASLNHVGKQATERLGDENTLLCLSGSRDSIYMSSRGGVAQALHNSWRRPTPELRHANVDLRCQSDLCRCNANVSRPRPWKRNRTFSHDAPSCNAAMPRSLAISGLSTLPVALPPNPSSCHKRVSRRSALPSGNPKRGNPRVWLVKATLIGACGCRRALCHAKTVHFAKVLPSNLPLQRYFFAVLHRHRRHGRNSHRTWTVSLGFQILRRPENIVRDLSRLIKQSRL